MSAVERREEGPADEERGETFAVIFVSVSSSLLPSGHIPRMFYPLLLTFAPWAIHVASHSLFSIGYR